MPHATEPGEDGRTEFIQSDYPTRMHPPYVPPIQTLTYERLPMLQVHREGGNDTGLIFAMGFALGILTMSVAILSCPN